MRAAGWNDYVCPEILSPRWHHNYASLIEAAKNPQNQEFIKRLLADFSENKITANIFSHSFKSHKHRAELIKKVVRCSLAHVDDQNRYRSRERVNVGHAIKEALNDKDLTEKGLIAVVNDARSRIKGEYKVFSPSRSMLYQDLCVCAETVVGKFVEVTEDDIAALQTQIRMTLQINENNQNSRWRKLRRELFKNIGENRPAQAGVIGDAGGGGQAQLSPLEKIAMWNREMNKVENTINRYFFSMGHSRLLRDIRSVRETIAKHMINHQRFKTVKTKGPVTVKSAGGVPVMPEAAAKDDGKSVAAAPRPEFKYSLVLRRSIVGVSTQDNRGKSNGSVSLHTLVAKFISKDSLGIVMPLVSDGDTGDVKNLVDGNIDSDAKKYRDTLMFCQQCSLIGLPAIISKDAVIVSSANPTCLPEDFWENLKNRVILEFAKQLKQSKTDDIASAYKNIFDLFDQMNLEGLLPAQSCDDLNTRINQIYAEHVLDILINQIKDYMQQLQSPNPDRNGYLALRTYAIQLLRQFFSQNFLSLSDQGVIISRINAAFKVNQDVASKLGIVDDERVITVSDFSALNMSVMADGPFTPRSAASGGARNLKSQPMAVPAPSPAKRRGAAAAVDEKHSLGSMRYAVPSSPVDNAAANGQNVSQSPVQPAPPLLPSAENAADTAVRGLDLKRAVGSLPTTSVVVHIKSPTGLGGSPSLFRKQMVLGECVVKVYANRDRYVLRSNGSPDIKLHADQFFRFARTAFNSKETMQVDVNGGADTYSMENFTTHLKMIGTTSEGIIPASFWPALQDFAIEEYRRARLVSELNQPELYKNILELLNKLHLFCLLPAGRCMELNRKINDIYKSGLAANSVAAGPDAPSVSGAASAASNATGAEPTDSSASGAALSF